jgi:hypothetical protein
MSFCGAEATALTDTDLTATFGTLQSPGILPAESFTASSRDGNGLLKQDILSNYVLSLRTSGKIPMMPQITAQNRDKEGDIIEQFMKKDGQFIENIKNEYCFYNSRYRYSLRQLISKLQAGYNASSQQNTQLIQKYLQATQGLNQRLNDLSQIVNEIAKNRVETTRQKDSNINILNNELNSRSKKLIEQNKILSSEQATALLYKNMVDYSKEKTNNTDNLLSMYSFANIIIIGLLFYLYRSMS